MDPIPDTLSAEALEASREAVHAQRNAAQAIETARVLQQTAMNEATTQSLVDALHDVFGEYSEQQRFIDTKRIPLICKQIESIHANLEEIKTNMVNQDQFAPVKIIAYGLVGTVMIGVVGAILSVVLIK